ncbi:probable G-protein coupled receptor 139 [Lineus longissimus]|uniref:probable G-protein coupled receptor 139 n=1 Tax=Lineus longissimus TaxID=88925 RepID=UPI00315D02B7
MSTPSLDLATLQTVKSRVCIYDTAKFTYTHNMYVFGVGCICIVGLILNVLNARTFAVMEKGKSLVLYLLRILAFSDGAVLITSFVIFPLRHTVARIVNGDDVFIKGDLEIMPYIYFPVETPYFISVEVRNHMMVLLAIDRFIKLIFPLKGKLIATRSNANKAIVFIVVLAFACNLWRYWWMYVGKNTDPCHPDDQDRVKRRGPGQLGYYIDWAMYIAVLFAVPLLLLLILNLAVIISLISNMAKTRQLRTTDSNEAAQHQLSVMTACTCTLFLICELPACIDRVGQIYVALAGGAAYWRIGGFIRKAGLLLTVLDSSLNFFIYMLTNRKFRSTLLKGPSKT